MGSTSGGGPLAGGSNVKKLHSTCRLNVPIFPLLHALFLPWGGLPKVKADTTKGQQQRTIAALGETKAPHE